MEGTPTPDLYDLLKKVSESPMLGFTPAEYFERATLIFMQFSQMSRKINENHNLLLKVLTKLEEANHMLRKISKMI